MKKILLTTAALLISAGAASAADLAARPYTKAPPAPVIAATNWSGFYLGGFGGYGWSESVRARVPGVGSASANTSDINGGFGGGTIGYNWQSPGSQFVWGLEVDAAGADISDSATVFGVTGRDKIDAFGSVTGRIGVAFDAVLLYAKGGYGWADNKISATGRGVNFSEWKIHSGWTVGGGLEWMFAPQWSAKVEYQYYDLDRDRYLAAVIPPGVDLSGSFHTAKVGVNYHFGGPALARY